MVNLLGDSVRLLYSGRVTALSDVVVNLFDPDDTQVLTNEVMSEIESTKIYAYEYTPTKLGDHYGYIDSATSPFRLNVSFRVSGRAISPVSSQL